MDNQELAILGGKPVRNKKFKVEPMVDEREEELVLKAIRDKNFSRYIGSKPSNFEETLTLESSKALSIKDEWHFLGGPNIRKFSYDFAKFFNVKYAIPVNSATSGISTAIAALGLNDGDEVIIPGLSYTASGTAPLLFNAIPKFVDIDINTFCIDPNEIEKSISKKTKAILCVHLLGNVCDMRKIMEIAKKYNLKVIEDTAQAPGAKFNDEFAGTIGDIGIFSFQQSKNIMTGEGGMIITNDKNLAKRCRLIINHGEVCFDDYSSEDEMVNMIGCNFRLTELSAALGIAQLEKLNKVNHWRNENANYLIKQLKDFSFLIPPFVSDEVVPIFHILNFKYDFSEIGLSRDIFVACLRAEGIPIGTGYVRAMYNNPLFLKKIAYGINHYPWNKEIYKSSVNYSKDQCKNINKLLKKEFLWFYHIAHPSTLEDMDDIVSAIKKIWNSRKILQENSKLILEKGDISLKQGRI